jgi:DNA-binding winged helix-turn-helix (wHTH) protein
MLEASPQPRTLRFGPCEVDLSTGELRRDGAKVALQDKPFQILALLVERRGQLVTREELRSRLWPMDTFVDFEHGLNTAVKKLRQALDDSAEQPRYVETLPKRGYRFLAPVEGDGQAVETPSPLPGPAPHTDAPAPPRRTRWSGRAAAALAAVVVLAALAARLRPGASTATPAANLAPVIVLMDSPLPGRVYDPRTLAAGGTNADDLTDALRDLPVVIEKENTSPMWHREAQVLQQKPDLIISHLSCLYDERVAPGQPDVLKPLFNSAVERLISFFGYVAANNPRTQFLIYSRGRFQDYGGPETFTKDVEARFPALHGRLQAWTVPRGPDGATFRDPATTQVVRERVKAALRLP